MHLVRRWVDLALCATAFVMDAGCAAEGAGGRAGDGPRDEGVLAVETHQAPDAMVPTGGPSPMDGGAARAPGASAPDGSTASTAATPTGGITCADRIAPTAEAVQQVIQRSCGLSRSCHAGTSPQAGLDLSSLDGIFATAVDRPAMQDAELMLIAPGKPEASYLMRKIDNAQTVGTAMPPPPSAALCEAKRSAIEAWIRAGASR